MTNESHGESKSPVQGRCIQSLQEGKEWKILVSHLAGNTQIRVISPRSPCQIGDIVAYHPETKFFAVLTETKRPGKSSWNEKILSPRRRHAMKVRQKVEKGIREFFETRDFIETRTPTLVPCPGMEIHIRPFQTTSGAYLPTSPEFAMKRLLVGGLERIFQITQSFRSEPNSTTHHPEFTMLEWYRAYAGFTEIMEDTEKLVESLALKIHGKAELTFGGQKISVKAPWKRQTVTSLFREHLNLPLSEKTSIEALMDAAKARGHTFPPESTWDDLFFLLWLNEIEPNFPKNEAIIVSHYPPSQAALSVVEVDAKGERWARRFEFYIAGLELGNAFEELTNADEQRERFIADMRSREKIYGAEFPKNPLDEEFLSALEEGMPPAGGIAVGVDRLVMLLADEQEIAQTMWLASYAGEVRNHL